MRILAVDANNDLYLGADRQLAMGTGIEALKQAAEHVMRSVLGEMVHAVDRGLPYMETVYCSAPNLRLFEDYSRRSLRAVKGVQAVESFTCEVADNTLRYAAELRTIYGLVSLNGENRNA